MSIFISAGEASGDHYIALLAKTLREVGCSADIWGMGGAEAQEQGVRTEWNGEELQLMGFTEILHAIPKIFKLKEEIIARIMDLNPKAVIVADSPDFHMRLISNLRKKGYKGKIFYISPPTVWAWRSGRIKALRRDVDLCLPLYEFEHDYLVSNNCASYWSGAPLLEEFDEKNFNREDIPRKLADNTKLVAILPGSRMGEIKKHMPLLEQVADELTKRGWTPVFSVAPGLNKHSKEELLHRLKLNNRDYYEGPGRHLMSVAKCIIGASGTTTVESLILNCYMIVTYKVNSFSAFVVRAMVRTKFFAMANLLAGYELFPELLQEKATAENILKYTLDWLDGEEKVKKTTYKKMAETRLKLGKSAVYESWAHKILENI